MRVLVVGASGMLGRSVVAALSPRHEVIEASRSGAVTVDLADPSSIQAMYEDVGHVDAVACTAGVVPFDDVATLSVEDFRRGITDKLLGQIALVRLGLDAVTSGGSFTLVSGVLSCDPIRTGSVAATVNGGIDSFVIAAAIELTQRINAVSATVFAEAWDSYGEYFPGFEPTPVAHVANAFVKSIDGAQTGRIYRVGY